MLIMCAVLKLSSNGDELNLVFTIADVFIVQIFMNLTLIVLSSVIGGSFI